MISRARPGHTGAGYIKLGGWLISNIRGSGLWEWEVLSAEKSHRAPRGNPGDWVWNSEKQTHSFAKTRTHYVIHDHHSSHNIIDVEAWFNFIKKYHFFLIKTLFFNKKFLYLINCYCHMLWILKVNWIDLSFGHLLDIQNVRAPYFNLRSYFSQIPTCCRV